MDQFGSVAGAARAARRALPAATANGKEFKKRHAGQAGPTKIQSTYEKTLDSIWDSVCGSSWQIRRRAGVRTVSSNSTYDILSRTAR